MLRVGPQLKPFSSYRRVRWCTGAPMFWAIADQGGSFIDASDSRWAITSGGSVSGIAGKCGPALGFNGSNAYTSTPDNTAFNLSFPFTITMRVAFTSGVNAGILEHNGNFGYSVNCGEYATGGLLSLWSGRTASGVITNHTYNDGRWHHAVFVIAGSWSDVIYVDGKADSSIGYNGPATTPSYAGDPLIIGAYGGPNYFFPGSLDDVRIYNYALTAGQAMADYLDPWWRLRRKRPWWMGQTGGAAYIFPWWDAYRPMMGALGGAA